MKSKILLLAAGIMFSAFTTTLQAQNNSLKFENLVNEQFGTLLVSLLTNGKIEKANAKTYLQTVFGYDSAVSNYLQTENISQQINNIQQGNMSFDNYVTAFYTPQLITKK